MNSCSGAPPTTRTNAPSTAAPCSPNSGTSGRNLSDAELDLQPPAAARPALPAVPPPPAVSGRRGRPGGGPGLPRAAQRRHRSHTAAGNSPRSSLPAGGNPTTVMSAAPRRPGYGPLSAPDEAPYAPGYTTTRTDRTRGSAQQTRAAQTDRDEEKAASAPRPRPPDPARGQPPAPRIAVDRPARRRGAARRRRRLVLRHGSRLAGNDSRRWRTRPLQRPRTCSARPGSSPPSRMSSTTTSRPGSWSAPSRSPERSSANSSRCPSPSPRAPNCSRCRN